MPASISIHQYLLLFNMQSQKDMRSQEQSSMVITQASLQADHRRTPYKEMFFVTFAILFLALGYIIGNASANKAALAPSNPQKIDSGKEQSTTTRSAADVSTEQNLKKNIENAAVMKPDSAQVPPIVPAAVESPKAVPVSSSASVTSPNATKVLPEAAKEENKTKMYSFSLAEKSNISVVFLTCCHRHYMLEETVSSFIEINEYPFKKLIVVNDGPSNPQVNAIAAKFPNLTMLSTGDKGGQLRAIDEALKLVDTPYVYYSEDDFKMVHAGLITSNIEELEKDPKLLQMWNDKHLQSFTMEENRIVDRKWMWGGFSFHPSVWRMSDYFLLEGGFAKFTNDKSRGTGAGVGELMILNEYKKRGFYVRQSVIEYLLNLGINKGLPRQGS